MKRPFDKHIDNDELNALVPWSRETGPELHGLSAEAVFDAERHAQSCMDCSKKVTKYQQFLSRFSNVADWGAAPPEGDCPRDIDWYEVAVGLWPELKARQLIMHAALCDHCGPLLRTAASLDQTATPQEEKLLAELKTPSQPASVPQPRSWPDWRGLVPAVASILIVAALVTRWVWLPPLSGAKFAAFAVSTLRQQAQGNLSLDVRADSQQTLNEWFGAKSAFSLALPASPAAPGEDRPYRLEGARLVQIAGKPAVYIAYQMQTGPVGLMVAPDSVAAATGGLKVGYKKVTFYYRMVEGYKVVTWSLHGRTYALVSQEGNNTQRSCMVCHSPMRDRDLSQTPTPLPDQRVLP